MFNKTWEKLKSWFDYSTTILLARVTAASGFIIAVVGAADWSPLASVNFYTGLDWTEVFYLGLYILFQGLLTELARRRTL